MGPTGIIKIPKFTRLTDGVINSIRELRNLTIAYISHFSNYTDMILMHKHLPNRLIITIFNNPQEYSILLQTKIISTDNIEDYRNIKEIRVEGDNDPISIQQDIKKIIKSVEQIFTHQYYPF